MLTFIFVHLLFAIRGGIHISHVIKKHHLNPPCAHTTGLLFIANLHSRLAFLTHSYWFTYKMLYDATCSLMNLTNWWVDKELTFHIVWISCWRRLQSKVYEFQLEKLQSNLRLDMSNCTSDTADRHKMH